MCYVQTVKMRRFISPHGTKKSLWRYSLAFQGRTIYCNLSSHCENKTFDIFTLWKEQRFMFSHFKKKTACKDTLEFHVWKCHNCIYFSIF